MDRIAIRMALCLLPVSLGAQWINFRTPGIPRTADGKPNLTASAPRTPDGKPDLSGLWRPEANPYRFDLIQNLKDEDVFRPEAKAIFTQRVADFRRGDPVTHCLPAGPAVVYQGGAARLYRIIQSSAVIGVLHEDNIHYQQIFTDGRELPDNPNPTWMGYSVGHWEGDTLVVETIGFNDQTWLDRVGHPHSEELRVTERFRRVDFGHMQLQITYEDPKMLTRSLTISVAVNYAPDTEMLEYLCGENERDTGHLVGNAAGGIKLSPAILDKYVGSYEFRDGPAGTESFFPRKPTISIQDGQLYYNDLPLIPQSETSFDATAAAIEFVTNEKGAVTHFLLNAAEGDARYDRKH
jgi:hypothetical protein